MKHFVSRPSKTLSVAVFLLSAAMVFLALSPSLNGGRPNFVGVALNLIVALSVVFQSRLTRLVVLGWALIPILASALYFVGSAMAGSLGPWPEPLSLAFIGVLGAVLFLWAWRSSARPVPNNSFKGKPLRGSP
jgi:hypothetical protein